MLGGLIDKWKRGQVANELLRNPTVAIGRDAIRSIWASAEYSGDFSPEFRQEMGEMMMQRCIEIASSNDPVKTCRDYLSGAAQETATLEVARLGCPGSTDINGMAHLPGVTGELYKHIGLIARTHSTIRELVQGMPEPPRTDADILDVLLWRYRIVHAHMSVYNVLRIQLKDNHGTKERDWFRPFYRTCVVWYEQALRQDADLGLTLEPVESLEYYALIKSVDEGDRYPNLTWEKDFGRPLP